MRKFLILQDDLLYYITTGVIYSRNSLPSCKSKNEFIERKELFRIIQNDIHKETDNEYKNSYYTLPYIHFKSMTINNKEYNTVKEYEVNGIYYDVVLPKKKEL